MLTPEQRLVQEETTPVYAASLVDDVTDPLNPAPIGVDDLEEITLTYFDIDSGEIQNNRYFQDVKNDNNVTIDANGRLIWVLQIEDTKIVDQERPMDQCETHRAMFTYKWQTLGQQLVSRGIVDIDVSQKVKVPQVIP